MIRDERTFKRSDQYFICDSNGRYVVYEPHCRPSINNNGSIESGPCNRRLSPNLLATNKQVHSEAKGLLYGQTLRFNEGHTLDAFLHIIGLSNLALIRDVHVYDTSPMFAPRPSTMSRLLKHVWRLRFELRSG